MCKRQVVYRDLDVGPQRPSCVRTMRVPPLTNYTYILLRYYRAALLRDQGAFDALQNLLVCGDHPIPSSAVVLLKHGTLGAGRIEDQSYSMGWPGWS